MGDHAGFAGQRVQAAQQGTVDELPQGEDGDGYDRDREDGVCDQRIAGDAGVVQRYRQRCDRKGGDAADR